MTRTVEQLRSRVAYLEQELSRCRRLRLRYRVERDKLRDRCAKLEYWVDQNKQSERRDHDAQH